MPISPEDKEFLNGPFQKIEGWCMEESAWLTTHLLRVQQDLGHLAPAFEIGVYRGKYLSVIYNALRSSGQQVIGFDTFQWVSQPEVVDALTGAFGSLDGLKLIAGDSTEMNPEILSAHLDGKQAGFISIDGAHTPEPVLKDLLLCQTALEPWGIVAVDDFLNPRAIGVTEGAMRFWLNEKTDLIPFCYCGNKLYTARPAAAGLYSAEVLKFCEENQNVNAARVLVQLKTEQGIHWVKQEFLGQHIWII